MPLASSVVGSTAGPCRTDVDRDWVLAYAGATGARVAHPLFPVCVEWATRQAAVPPAGSGLTIDELRRGVHFAHDLILHDAWAAPTMVETNACVVEVSRHRAGAVLITRIDACDPAGRALWTTWMTSLFRGVAIEGPDTVADRAPQVRTVTTGEPVASCTLDVAETAAHVYTACSRIWNPIHTDAAVATAAGLPGPILHGTATLARGVSAVLGLAGDVDPCSVRRIRGRFGAMVPMPSTVTAQLLGSAPGAVAFDVRTEAGQPAIRDGILELR